MDKDECKSNERKDNRIKYKPKKRPKLQIKTHFFEFVEISEKELCLINDDKIIFDKKI